MERYGVLLATTHSHLEDPVRAALGRRNDFSFWGRAASGFQVVTRFTELAPSILLLDVDLPDISPISLIRFVEFRHPTTHVLGFSTCENVSVIRDFVQAGAGGYLLATDAPHDLPNALHAALAGRSVFSARASQLLLHPL